MSIPGFTEGKDGVRRGDILDLMNHYGRGSSGKISLQDIRAGLDAVIGRPPNDARYKLTLESTVKATCDETIVEPLAHEGNYPGYTKEPTKPKALRAVALDIFCGLNLRGMDPYGFFDSVGTQ